MEVLTESQAQKTPEIQFGPGCISRGLAWQVEGAHVECKMKHSHPNGGYLPCLCGLCCGGEMKSGLWQRCVQNDGIMLRGVIWINPCRQIDARTSHCANKVQWRLSFSQHVCLSSSSRSFLTACSGVYSVGVYSNMSLQSSFCFTPTLMWAEQMNDFSCGRIVWLYVYVL